MRYGTATEPAARAAFELESGLVMQPLVMVDGDYSASLDGTTLSGDTLLEIKCPYRGQTSELWHMVKDDVAPLHFMLQVLHQLMVSHAKLACLWVYDGQHGVGISIEPNPETFKQIKAAWNDFQLYIDHDTPPSLTEQDTVKRNDEAWQQAAEAYLTSKAVSDEAEVKAAEAKADFIRLTSHSRESGFGVSVTKYWKQGNVDYKKVPQLQGIDLELYRGRMREEIRVTVVV